MKLTKEVLLQLAQEVLEEEDKTLLVKPQLNERILGGLQDKINKGIRNFGKGISNFGQRGLDRGQARDAEEASRRLPQDAKRLLPLLNKMSSVVQKMHAGALKTGNQNMIRTTSELMQHVKTMSIRAQRASQGQLSTSTFDLGSDFSGISGESPVGANRGAFNAPQSSGVSVDPSMNPTYKGSVHPSERQSQRTTNSDQISRWRAGEDTATQNWDGSPRQPSQGSVPDFAKVLQMQGDHDDDLISGRDKNLADRAKKAKLDKARQDRDARRQAALKQQDALRQQRIANARQQLASQATAPASPAEQPTKTPRGTSKQRATSDRFAPTGKGVKTPKIDAFDYSPIEDLQSDTPTKDSREAEEENVRRQAAKEKAKEKRRLQAQERKKDREFQKAHATRQDPFASWDDK